MSGLEIWLAAATRGLARDSAALVRGEIREHFESARESAIADGASAVAAEASALRALGDASIANCQYRQVLLTSAEARLLREGGSEARAVCSRPWLKWLLIALPVVLVEAAAVMFFRGRVELAQELLSAGLVMSPLFAALLLPIHTPGRARMFRYGKWTVMVAGLVMLYGPETLKWSWLLISCLWPMAWTELTRASIRRKLPVSDWPRHLYL